MVLSWENLIGWGLWVDSNGVDDTLIQKFCVTTVMALFKAALHKGVFHTESLLIGSDVNFKIELAQQLSESCQRHHLFVPVNIHSLQGCVELKDGEKAAVSSL